MCRKPLSTLCILCGPKVFLKALIRLHTCNLITAKRVATTVRGPEGLQWLSPFQIIPPPPGQTTFFNLHELIYHISV